MSKPKTPTKRAPAKKAAAKKAAAAVAPDPLADAKTKLQPFAHLFGNVPDEKLAEMAGVSIEAVKALGWPAPDASPRPSADASAPTPTDARPAELTGLPPATVASARAEVESKRAPAAPAKKKAAAATLPPDPAPTCVRVTAHREHLVRDDGKPFTVRRRDVYSGEKAGWLWAHHRDLVEAYAGVSR